MMSNALFWAGYIRNLIIPEIQALAHAFDSRVLLAFQGLEEEANRIQDEKRDKLCQGAGPDTDFGDIAEAAQDAGIDHYITMKDIQQGVTNLFAAALYHLFEQQLLLIHRKELLLKEEEDDETKLSRAEAMKRLRRHEIDIESFRAWPKLDDELRRVANVVKHADGKSSSELKQLRSDLFHSPDPVVREIWEDRPRFRRQVFQPLFGQDFYITPEEFQLYAEKVVEFWEEFADVLERQ